MQLPKESEFGESTRTKQVQSLVRTVDYHETSRGNLYIKPDPTGQEYRQLLMLQKLGLPVPEKIYYLPGTKRLATSASGEPLHAKYWNAEHDGKLSEYLQKASHLLQQVHSKIQGVHPSILRNSAGETSHPINNFKHRFESLNSTSTNSFLEQDPTNSSMQEEFKKLTNLMLMMIDIFSVKIDHVISEEDDENFLGDFKPENLVLNGADQISIIDPQISKGSRYFDVSKFFSRSILDGIAPKNIKPFLTQYEDNLVLDKKVYQNLTLRDLITVDMLNILSSYLGRFFEGKHEYRLVRQLSNPKKINQITSFLGRAKLT